MKRIFVIGLMLTAYLSAGAQVDAISKYFDKYIDDERFTMVYVSPKMFNLVSKMNVEDMDADVKQLLNEIRGLRILTTDENPMQYYKEALASFNVSEYERLMEVRDEDEKIHFLIKSGEGDRIEELLLLVGGSEFVLLSFVGNIDLNKISKLASGMDIKGAEHLDKIKSDK